MFLSSLHLTRDECSQAESLYENEILFSRLEYTSRNSSPQSGRA